MLLQGKATPIGKIYVTVRNATVCNWQPSRSALLLRRVSELRLKVMMNAELMMIARQVYDEKICWMTLRDRQPTGVVVNVETLRGELLCSPYPVLLPHERFIPLNQLEMAMAS